MHYNRRMTTRRRRRGTTREEAVNTLLAQELRRHGLSAAPERRGREGVPDVRIELRGGELVLLECKWESTAAQLNEQLEGRLTEFPDAVAVVGVTYPDSLREVDDTQAALESTAELRWRIYGSRGVVAQDRPERSGSAQDLADQLLALPLDMEGTDLVSAAATVIGNGVGRAVAPIRRHQRIAARIAAIIAEADKESDRLAALQIGCLVLFNALAFQDRLAEANPDVPTVRESWGSGLDGIRQAWDAICDEIDYVPVFEIAGQIADVLSDGPDELRQSVMEPLIQAMVDTRGLEGHDLSGRLFHTLLTAAKFTGAYYTSVPAATMLARLVFEDWPTGVDWSDHEFPASLNVADLACGTGTLLMAVASEAQRRHESAGGRNAPELHKAMVEQALHGYDVQLSAIHFAATSLAMLNPEIQFDRMNLYVMPLGVEEEEISLGSLEFLLDQRATVQYALSPETLGVEAEVVGQVTGSGTRGVVSTTLPDLDLAIMNPPFTRSVGGNLLFGNRQPADRRKLQDELSRRLRARDASATAGLGAAFVAAAAPRLRPGEGRLALVLPATVCTGPSWEQTRALIQRDFELDMVITSHDPQRWNFSDSTGLSEVLIIANRRSGKKVSKTRRVHYVNLWRNPDGIIDAHLTAQAISGARGRGFESHDITTNTIRMNEQGVGEITGLPAAATYDRWYGGQFSRGALLRGALTLINQNHVAIPGTPTPRGAPRTRRTPSAPVPLCPLDNLGEIGPDRRRIVDGFNRTSEATEYPFIDNHDTEIRRSMVVRSPDSYLAPLPEPRGGQQEGYGEHLWSMAGQLLIAERLRLNTARVVAMCASTPVLSNVWWPFKAHDPDWDKPLALWLNGSLGILAMLAVRTSTEGGWVALKKAELAELAVLDPRALTPEQLQALSNLFDEMAETEFQRLPEMGQCPARRALDDGLSRILNLPDMVSLRRLLATEPVVSNRRL